MGPSMLHVLQNGQVMFTVYNKVLSRQEEQVPQYPTPILNIPEVVAFLHVITEDKSRVNDIKRV